MIILRGEDEQALVAEIEKIFKDRGVDIFQSDEDEGLTQAEFLTFLAFNTKQIRIYVGRLERNTRKMEEDMRRVIMQLEPMASYFTVLLEESGYGVADAKRLAQVRESEKKASVFFSPTIGGGRNQKPEE